MIFSVVSRKCKWAGGGWACYQDNEITVDPRLEGVDRDEVILHEIIDAVNTNEFNKALSHKRIDRLSQVLAENLMHIKQRT